MRLDLHRVHYEDDFTSGYLKLNGQFECYTLEDEKRKIKIDGETCIPTGIYNVISYEADTPLTLSYRKKYPFFKYHLMLVDVQGFANIYIHVGNDDDDTDGCILVGQSINDAGFLGSSGPAYEALYKQVTEALNNCEEVTIHIQ